MSRKFGVIDAGFWRSRKLRGASDQARLPARHGTVLPLRQRSPGGRRSGRNLGPAGQRPARRGLPRGQARGRRGVPTGRRPHRHGRARRRFGAPLQRLRNQPWQLRQSRRQIRRLFGQPLHYRLGPDLIAQQLRVGKLLDLPGMAAFRHAGLGPSYDFARWAQGCVEEELAELWGKEILYDATDERYPPGTRRYRIGKGFRDFLLSQHEKPDEIEAYIENRYKSVVPAGFW